MSVRAITASFALLLLVAPEARAQVVGRGLPASVGATPDLWATPLINGIEFGARGTDYDDDSDPARFQRYRDLRNGGTLDRVRFSRDTDVWTASLQADRVGYRDQRYAASFNRFGKVKASFVWNQVPLFYSEDTRTLYTSPSAGVLRLDDGIQNGIQNRTLTLASVIGLASPFDLRSRRDIADFSLTYSATPHLDLNLSLRNSGRDGNQQWAGTFGFGNTVEIAAPVDDRTTDLATSVEWTHDRGVVRVGYDGSFYRNSVSTLVWDNPNIGVDTPTAGASQGRMALWPDSNLNAGSVMASLKLPSRSHATAYVSIGEWSQNDPLIPFTTNTQLSPTPLSRATADLHARVTAMHYTFTSRPTNVVWFNARYRRYDFDNQSTPFDLTNVVNYDQTVAAFAHGHTTPFSYVRNNFDAETSLTPLAYVALRAGYSQEAVDRTFRLFEETREHTFRASVDSAGITWLSVRGLFEHSKRVGSGLDEEAFTDIGEQVSLRQFDISDRNSTRVSALLQVVPLPQLSFNAVASAGTEERPDASFGLRDNDNRSVSFGVDVVPIDAISIGLTYGYEKYTALQASRQALPPPSPQFTDPTRDWTTDSNDTAHTFTIAADLLKLLPKTEIRFGYDRSDSRSVYVYGLAPNSTLTTPIQLPAIQNGFERATANVRYFLTPKVALGIGYWHDRYTVKDFALGRETLTRLDFPAILMMGYLYRPYAANSVWARLTYLW
jgi:MtrB/PioB family decaheme-associated outer membrane protein